MKRGLAVVFSLCLILGFQNCSQSSLQGSGDFASEEVSVKIPSSGHEVSDGSSSSASVTYIEIPEIDQVASGIAAKASASASLRLVVSTASGRIQLMDERNEVHAERCLSGERLQEMKTILAGSAICNKVVSQDTMCAMSYTPAYVSLYANERRVRLGEKMDSCGTGSRDLCGGLSDVFQAYVAHVKTSWESMSCE